MVSETGVTTDIDRSSQSSLQRVLCLCGDRSTATDLAERLGPGVKVIPVRSPAKAIARLAKGGFDGIYADAEHFAPTADATQLIHNVQILSAMPDGRSRMVVRCTRLPQHSDVAVNRKEWRQFADALRDHLLARSAG